MTYISNQPTDIVKAKTIYCITNKLVFVQIQSEYISRLVRITFRSGGKKITGHLVFNTRGNDEDMNRLCSVIKLRSNDALATEEIISVYDIGMIEYL